MKSAFISALRVLATCAFALTLPVFALAQQQPKDPKISDGERKALEKVQSSADLPAKLKAAGEFIKKYPKSSVRVQVAGYLGNEVLKIEDPAQQIPHLEAMVALFDQPAEAENIYPPLINAYVKAKRFDEAFAASAKLLEKSPGDVTVMTQMAFIGIEQFRLKNPKYAQQSQQYAARAIALMEEDKKPANMDAEKWSEYKVRWLPGLYQSLGVMAFLSQDKASAREHLDKAASLNSPDPVTYMLIGTIIDDEYQELAKKYQGMSGGPLKDELYKEVLAKMDQVMEQFAHAIALAEGSEDHKTLHEQLLGSLEQYYKFRHKGSTEGMRALIDKYKVK